MSAYCVGNNDLTCLQDCPIFAPSAVSTASKVSTTPSTAVYCDDCESSEHDLKSVDLLCSEGAELMRNGRISQRLPTG